MNIISPVLIALSILAAPAQDAIQPKTVRVAVWDERQPKQKQMYENFLGNHIADYLRSRPGFTVRSVGMDDPNQGLTDELLDNCDVLIWWGHQRQAEITMETAQRIVDRIKAGKLSLIALHSAHWSTPFVLAMHERAQQNAMASLPPSLRDKAKVEWVGEFERKAPDPNAELTPAVTMRKTADGKTLLVTITRPNCCFPYYKAHGKPSNVKTLLPDHPIAQGIPAEFTIPQTEMYGEPFHVPRADEVIFEERWEDGKWFRAGAIWNLGKGKVFYFRPGHENFNVFKQAEPLKIIENAARYLATTGK
ncbi:MAG TPA: ThuA domain-containing protein [Sedimentisphaerales bacterium]|nr:ThuA domain-containing protein [Sedimentisphaerales bacterium]